MRAVTTPVSERRAYSRRSENLRVLVCDPEDALNEPYPGWVVDRSPGGVRLSFDCSRIDVSTELQILSATSALPIEVRVRNRRRREGRVELGCEFVQPYGERSLLMNQPAAARVMAHG